MVVAEEFQLGGQLLLTRPAIVHGRMDGVVRSTSSIVVGPTAVVSAEIHARSVTVRGAVAGTITAEEWIRIEAGGRVTADLAAPTIMIEAGAEFEGRCRMGPLAGVMPAPADPGPATLEVRRIPPRHTSARG
ncbi:MAG TPA: polymer-forming cytoskeletal protein [Longimicrobiales bacterium]